MAKRRPTPKRKSAIARGAPRKSKTAKTSKPVKRSAVTPKSTAKAELSKPESSPLVPIQDPVRFPVVGIGASAGGLEALEEFFSAVEPDSGLAYTVVTHQAAGRESLLPELVAKHARIPVTSARNGMKLEPNHAYVAPPGASLTIRNEVLLVEPLDAGERVLPIDLLFRSLAKNDGDRSIGIVLSGNGSDGSLGITEIKAASGMVMAQEPTSAKYAGMPSSAINTQAVDYVLPPKEMPARLAQYAQRKHRIRVSDAPEGDADPDAAGLQQVLTLLRARTGNDFTSYKKSTVRRRIERRMTVHGLRSVRDYTSLLERAPYELDALFKELLISVTSFFRDPEAFAALGTELGRLIQDKPDNSTLRVWVPGCATGEEAYSLAILTKELVAASQKNISVQIFATDLDVQAVEVARQGKYPEGITADVTPERLEKYFVKEDDGYRINKEIREALVFAPQNLAKDPPFTKLDLLSCRNLLIYLEPELQKRVLWLFSYSLNPGGLLFLGTSESVSGFEDLFGIADKKWKLFHRRDSGSKRLPNLQAEVHSTGMLGRAPAQLLRMGPRPAVGVGPVAERTLLMHFAPPSVIMSERGEIIYLHGRTGPFLEPAPGEPTNNVFHMAREGLRHELPAAIRQALTTDAPIVRRGLQVKTNGGFTSVRLTVRKLAEPETLRGAFVASFEKEPEEPTHAKSNKGHDRKYLIRIATLEEDLQRTKESLQGTIEELETSNEELKSTNEELQSTNEELQSANEELETSREEMQSLNEELQTVNAELEERNRALSQANDDMQNLLNSTDVATIFLDDKLAIKRFTTQAKRVFSLIETDVGRPISDLAANLRYEGLIEEATEVLQTLTFREREIQTKEGSWRLMRVMPYRTHDNLIDGLVITFVDIDRVKRAEEEAQRAREYAERVVEAVRVALLVLDSRLRVVSANQIFYKAFKTTPKAVLGEPLRNLAEGRWDVPGLTGPLEQLLSDETRMTNLPISIALPRGGRRDLRVSARRLPIDGGRSPMILLAIESADGRSPDELEGE